MRITHLLTTGALALAIPALAQTSTAPVGRTPVPQATPTATPSSPAMPSAQPATPAAPTDGSAPAGTGVQQTTPSGTPDTTMTPSPAGTAAATAPVPPTVGATVYGSAGTPVGTIKAMDSQYVTLATEKGEVRLPAAGVGPGAKGPVIGLTAEQLDAAVTQAKAAQPAPAAATETKTTTTTKTKKKAR